MTKPMTMTLDTALVKQLAAQFGFDATEFLIAAAQPSARTDRTDFIAELESAEARDEATAKAKDKSLSPAAKKEAAAAKKAAKEAAKLAKEAKPKRAPTGYLLFCADTRADVNALLTDRLVDGEKLAPTDTVKELAARWNTLSEDERAHWKKVALTTHKQSSDNSSSCGTSDDEVVLSDSAPEPTPEPTPEPAPEPTAPTLVEPQPSARKSKAKKTPKLKTVVESKNAENSD